MKLNKYSDERFKNRLLLRSIKLVNLILMTASFAFLWYSFLADVIALPFFRKGNWFVVSLFLILYYVFGRNYNAFNISYQRISEVAYSQALALAFSDFFMYIITWLLMRRLPNIFVFAALITIQFCVAVLWSVTTHNWYFKVYPPKKSVIVWDMRKGLTELINEYGLSKKFEVIANYKIDECLKNLTVLDSAEVVFLSGIHSKDRNIIAKYCVEHDITAYIKPRIGDVLMSGAEKMHMFHLPILTLRRYNPTPEFLIVKRMFDVIVSLLGIIICSPIMLITAICIKSEDNGPVIYKQIRLTKDSKEFTILKFRSMCVDAEKNGIAKLSTGDKDDRITRVGRVMRKVRLDELPQLFNILAGDMSIVGPRPERPEIASKYEKELPEFKLRLQAKCGLTGYAQVYGKYNTSPYDKLQMDLMYIANPSVAQDLAIMFATVKILFMPESTEGVSQDNTTEMDIENSDNSIK